MWDEAHPEDGKCAPKWIDNTAILIDPGEDAPLVEKIVKEKGLKIS